jgi:predicted deacylase
LITVEKTEESGIPPLTIGSATFLPGDKGVVELPIGSLTGYQPISMSVHVQRSRKPGPTLLLTAGIHGDELIGVEILRRVLNSKSLRSLRGTLIVIPVVCMPAFLNRSRYLPDRRDLNRLFPGSSIGSLGSRLANAFVQEILPHCTHSIDFHGGTVGRPNLPQIRISPGDTVAAEMATAFKAPVVIETGLREGSLRHYLRSRGLPTLLFEGGEALRLPADSVRYGLRGIHSVLRHLHMLPALRKSVEPAPKMVFSNSTTWVRAPQGGLVIPLTDLGKAIKPGTKLGVIADPFGRNETYIVSEYKGIVIGITREGHADEGDALFHIATTPHPERAEANIQRTDEILEEHTDPLN